MLNVTSIFAKSVPRQPYVTKPLINLRHRYTNMISTFPQVKIQNVLVDINTWAVSFHIWIPLNYLLKSIPDKCKCIFHISVNMNYRKRNTFDLKNIWGKDTWIYVLYLYFHFISICIIINQLKANPREADNFGKMASKSTWPLQFLTPFDHWPTLAVSVQLFDLWLFLSSCLSSCLFHLCPGCKDKRIN